MVKSGLFINAVLFFSLFASARSAVTQPNKRLSALEHEQQVDISASLTWPVSSYSHECWMKRPVKLSAAAASLLQTTKRDGDGDGDGELTGGDGDGELEGDGDGELEGDGDGELQGDGDGELGGDGDGELQGDGDWDSSELDKDLDKAGKKKPSSTTGGDSTGGGDVGDAPTKPNDPLPTPPTKPPAKPPTKLPKPFETVLKDGFLPVDCVKDYMYNYGDKYGDGKFAYKFGKKSTTSIMRYDVLVAKEDRKEMTPKVCFEFCRTIPDMGFFGLLNGRTCYCTPYFKAIAGDSSMCDAVCPGDPTNMCGGQSKSQVFAMHMCASAEEDLQASAESSQTALTKMNTMAEKATSLSKDMQSGAASLQQSLGAAGDTAATNLMQKAKVFAGELEHQIEDVEFVSGELATLIDDSKEPGVHGQDPSSVLASEKLTENMDKTRAQGRKASDKLAELLDAGTKSSGETSSMYDGTAKQYYPLMYFVDKEFRDKPSTCGGDSVGKPMGETSLDGCAYACDENVHSCVGFSYYAQERLCFLMSKFTSAFYYTGCKSTDTSGTSGPPGFLQQPVFLQESKAADVTCMAKFSEFEGTTLKPDPSGKCKQCLKTITKADRCYK